MAVRFVTYLWFAGYGTRAYMVILHLPEHQGLVDIG